MSRSKFGCVALGLRIDFRAKGFLRLETSLTAPAKSSGPDYIVACIQYEPTFGEVEANMAVMEARIRESLRQDDRPITRFRRAGNVDGYLVDLVGQVDRVEGRIKRNRRQVEELVADAAHGHITVERMKSLGGDLAKEHLDLEAELAAARDRLKAQQSEAERQKHLESLREKLVRDWAELPFESLQSALRDIVDRIEVDEDDVRVFLRI